MKKTLRVNISGTIFNIDEDAYQKLKNYLDVIEARYNNTQEGMEVFSDIESRIAELLSEKITSIKTVINFSDVEEVIRVMGSPDDFDSSEQFENERNNPFAQTNRNKRRMYRDSEGKYIAGVASGVSHYFGVNPLIIRGLFLISLFFAGTGLFIYLILWIALPEAVTPSQKLEMKGEPITISNIENSLNEEFKNVKENFEKFKESGKYDELKGNMNRLVSGVGAVLITIIKVFLILVGVVLVISAISAIFGLTGGLFFADTIVSVTSEGMNTLDHNTLIDMIDDSSNKYFIYIGLILTTVLPLILILFFGLKLIFKFRSNNKVIFLSALGLWLAGIFMISISGFRLSANFRQPAEISEKKELSYDKSNTLFISLNEYNLDSIDDVLINVDALIVFEKDKKKTILLEPKVEILPSNSNQIVVELVRSSKGKSKKQAFDNAKAIVYKWEMTDSVLKISNFFEFPEKNRWRNQRLKVIIRIPIGKKVFIDEKMNNLYITSKNTEYFWDYEIVNRELIMTEDGLSIPQSFIDNENTRDTSFNSSKEVTDDMLNELEKELK